MIDGFVQLTSFPEPLLANLAKSKLEAEGIECHLANENTIRMDYFYSQALGGVKLFVRAEDAQRAQHALDTVEPLPEELPPAEDLAPDAVAPVEATAADTVPAEVPCPSCGSDNVYNVRHLRPLSVIAFFLGLPLLLWRRSQRCARCGKSWQKSA